MTHRTTTITISRDLLGIEMEIDYTIVYDTNTGALVHIEQSDPRPVANGPVYYESLDKTPDDVQETLEKRIELLQAVLTDQ